MAGGRIEHHVAVGRGHAQQEMRWKRYATHRNTELFAHLQIHYGQRNRNPATPLQHHVQVAVIGVVVVVVIAGETQLAEEEPIQYADFLLDVGVVGHTAAHTQDQLVDLGQYALQIEVQIRVLGERQRRLGERQTLVLRHWRGEIVEDARRRHCSVRLLKYAYLKPIAESIPKYSAPNTTRLAPSSMIRSRGAARMPIQSKLPATQCITPASTRHAPSSCAKKRVHPGDGW